MKNIVTVSGGTGGYSILSGLKDIPNISITALVSMADDGGSTGVLQDELGVLPPGDVRQCLVALSEHSDVVRKLISYRFDEGPFSGHSFGNILLATLEKVTGDFATGVEIASEILKVKGTVVPITKDKAELQIKLADGTLIEGEDSIDHANLQKSLVSRIFYKNEVKINEHARVAILKADYIILGPGDYYTSIISSLIITGAQETLRKAKAKIILPINLTNKPGHTLKWNASDYVKIIENCIGRKVDHILLNSIAPSKKQLNSYMELYKLEAKELLIEDDLGKDPRVFRKPLLSHAAVVKVKGDRIANTRSFIRHDSKKLAKAIEQIIKKK